MKLIKYIEKKTELIDGVKQVSLHKAEWKLDDRSKITATIDKYRVVSIDRVINKEFAFQIYQKMIFDFDLRNGLLKETYKNFKEIDTDLLTYYK